MDSTGDAASTSLGHDDPGYSCFLGCVGARNIQPLVLAWLMQIGWIVVGIRGPHLLKEWAYRSGAGSGFVGVAGKIGYT